MKITTQIVTEETFTFTPDDAAPFHIWSGRLRSWLLKNAMDKVVDCTFPHEPFDQLVRQHGIEQPRLLTMTEAQANEPVIIGEVTGGTHILIDGAHRRAYWATRGKHVLCGWIVPEEVWSAFLFDPAATGGYHAPDGSYLSQRRR